MQDHFLLVFDGINPQPVEGTDWISRVPKTDLSKDINKHLNDVVSQLFIDFPRTEVTVNQTRIRNLQDLFARLSVFSDVDRRDILLFFTQGSMGLVTQVTQNALYPNIVGEPTLVCPLKVTLTIEATCWSVDICKRLRIVSVGDEITTRSHIVANVVVTSDDTFAWLSVRPVV